jgi:hypothetical protein
MEAVYAPIAIEAALLRESMAQDRVIYMLKASMALMPMRLIRKLLLA